MNLYSSCKFGAKELALHTAHAILVDNIPFPSLGNERLGTSLRVQIDGLPFVTIFATLAQTQLKWYSSSSLGKSFFSMRVQTIEKDIILSTLNEKEIPDVARK